MGKKKVMELQMMKENMKQLNKKFVSSLVEILRQDNSASFAPAAAEYIIQTMNVVSNVQKRTGFACMEGLLDGTEKLLDKLHAKYIHVKLNQVEVKYNRVLQEKTKAKQKQMQNNEEILIRGTEEKDVTIGTRKRKNLSFPQGMRETSSYSRLRDINPFKCIREDTTTTDCSSISDMETGSNGSTLASESETMADTSKLKQTTNFKPFCFGNPNPIVPLPVPSTSCTCKRDLTSGADIDDESELPSTKRMKDSNVNEESKTTEANSGNMKNDTEIEEKSEATSSKTEKMETVVPIEEKSAASSSIDQVQVQDSQAQTNTKGDDENEVDEDPPKYEFNPVVENIAVYSIPCKLFQKGDGNFSDKGTGVLYVNPLNESPGKYQILIRADTSLGAVLFNVLLDKKLPFQKVGKNNILTFGMEPDLIGAGWIPRFKNYLIRVKSSEDADELIRKIQELKDQAD